jgi:hypothetical protein
VLSAGRAPAQRPRPASLLSGSHRVSAATLCSIDFRAGRSQLARSPCNPEQRMLNTQAAGGRTWFRSARIERDPGLTCGALQSRCRCGSGEPQSRRRRGRIERPVPVQMCQRRAQSRCRCGMGKPSPGADVARSERTLGLTWRAFARYSSSTFGANEVNLRSSFHGGRQYAQQSRSAQRGCREMMVLLSEGVAVPYWSHSTLSTLWT